MNVDSTNRNPLSFREKRMMNVLVWLNGRTLEDWPHFKTCPDCGNNVELYNHARSCILVMIKVEKQWEQKL